MMKILYASDAAGIAEATRVVLVKMHTSPRLEKSTCSNWEYSSSNGIEINIEH
jgi:hypothetical protein